MFSFLCKEVLGEDVEDVGTEDAYVTDLAIVSICVLDNWNVQWDYLELVRPWDSEIFFLARLEDPVKIIC